MPAVHVCIVQTGLCHGLADNIHERNMVALGAKALDATQCVAQEHTKWVRCQFEWGRAHASIGLDTVRVMEVQLLDSCSFECDARTWSEVGK